MRVPLLVSFMLFLGLAAGNIFAAGGNESCLSCHSASGIMDMGGPRLYIDEAKFTGSSHATVGCVSCHSSVKEAHPGDGIRPSKAECRDCHSRIEQEYRKGRHVGNASCADCHNPHAARNQRAVSGRDINAQCARCHEYSRTLTTHAGWLPQADLHMDAVACITCHTGSKGYYISISVEKRQSHDSFSQASFEDLDRISGGKGIQSLIDANGNGTVTLDELRKFNAIADKRGFRLSTMMLPDSMSHRFDIIDNRWNCSFCHGSGPASMQTSFISYPGKSGRMQALPVEKGAILDIMYGTPDLYLMGASRNGTLSIIGVAIIAGGLIMPVGHGAFRLLTRNKRKEH